MSRILILFSFAFRDVSKNRIVLTLTIVSLSIAFSAVFLTVSILDGFKQILIDGAIDTMGHLTIQPKGDDPSLKDSEIIMRFVRTLSNVEGASLHSRGGVGIRYKNKFSTPYKVLGVEIADELLASKNPEKVVEGRFLYPSDRQKVVLGLTLADSLVEQSFDKKRIEIGERIKLGSLSGKEGNYEVVGIIDAKTFLPNWNIYFVKKDLEQLDKSLKDSEIIVRLADIKKMQETKKLIEARFSDAMAVTWEEESGYINDIVTAVSFITGLINRLIVISIFVIISIIIFINVFQKRRQIGIIKSMGASNRFVVSIYIVETLTYSFLSGVIGFLLFLLFHQYSVEHPVSLLIGDFHTLIRPENIIFSTLTLFIAVIAGSLIPAFIAAKTKIIDVMRSAV